MYTACICSLNGAVNSLPSKVFNPGCTMWCKKQNVIEIYTNKMYIFLCTDFTLKCMCWV